MMLLDNHKTFDLDVIVNGKQIKRKISTQLRLITFLRDQLRLTGTKEVCSEGECGACTVLLDSKAVNSCLIFAVEAHGSEIITIEGLALNRTLNDLQQAFIDYHSVQCGYCIPGMILTGEELLKHNPNPTRTEIKAGLAGNICRCTGYHKIIDALANVHK